MNCTCASASLGICAAGIAIWIATPFFQSAYGAHDFWVTNPANCARRFTQVTGVALLLLALERVAGATLQRSIPIRFIEVFGTSSLAGYFYLESLLFYRIRGVSFLARAGTHAFSTGDDTLLFDPSFDLRIEPLLVPAPNGVHAPMRG